MTLCARCGVNPPNPRKPRLDNRGGIPKYCEPCRVESIKATGRASTRRYMKANPEKHREWQRNKHQRDRVDPVRRARVRERNRNYRRGLPIERRRADARWARFGITEADFQALWIGQDGACALCDQPFPATIEEQYARREPQVDHDHVTGRVRGLLCRVCNTRLGAVEKLTPDWWARLQHYARPNEDVKREAMEKLGRAVG